MAKGKPLCIGKWEIEVRAMDAIYEQKKSTAPWLGWCGDIAYEQFKTAWDVWYWLAPGSIKHVSGKYVMNSRVRVRIWSPDKKKRFVYIGFLDRAWAWWGEQCNRFKDELIDEVLTDDQEVGTLAA